MAQRTVWRVVMVGVLGTDQVQSQREAGDHRYEAYAGKNQNRISQSPLHVPRSHAHAGHRPSNRTCWRLMMYPLWGILAMGSEMPVRQCVTPQLVHVK